MRSSLLVGRAGWVALAMAACGARTEPAAMSEGDRCDDDPRWAIQTIDFGFIEGIDTAEDPDGALHVVYVVRLNLEGNNVQTVHELRHARLAEGSWGVDVIEPRGLDPMQRDVAVAIDDSGAMHLGWASPVPDAMGMMTSSELLYATRVGAGAWMSLVVDRHAGNTIWGPDVEIGPTGEVHMLYSYFADSDQGDVRHATNRTGSFESDVACTNAAHTGPGAMVLDSDGNTWARCVGLTGGAGDRSLDAANDAGLGWQHDHVASDVDTTGNLVIDAGGRPRLAWTSWPASDEPGEDDSRLPRLLYAVHDEALATWPQQQFGVGGDAPSGPWLAPRADGLVAIVYEDRGAILRRESLSARLRFYGGEGDLETVDEGFEAFEGVLLLRGADEIPHVIYSAYADWDDHNASRELRHAVRTAGSGC